MPPRAKAPKISEMLDSASEDEFQRSTLDDLATPDSAIENRPPPARGGRGRGAKAAVDVAKPAGRGRGAGRGTGTGTTAKKGKTAAAGKKAQPSRKVLSERDNNGNMSDAEEGDEFADAEEVEEVAAAPVAAAKPTRRGRPPAKAKAAQEEEPVAEAPKPKKRGRQPAEPKEPKVAAAAPKAATKAKTTKRAQPEPEPEPEQENQEPTTIAETQPDPDPMDIDPSETIEVSEIPDSMPPPPSRPAATAAANRRAAAIPPRSESRQRTIPPGARMRAGSASDTERGTSDPQLRRKLGEMTKKFETLQVKYDNLKETASTTKTSNFEQLRARTEKVAKDQDAVIASLKQEIASLQTLTSETASLRKQLQTLSSQNEKLSSENAALSKSLSTMQSENKTLSTKLAAARSAPQPEAKTVPGSAVKPRNVGVVLPGAKEAAEEMHVRQLKEDLYSDLTGLIMRGVKKGEEGEDVYDCIQTGRNGTLHFHLSIAPASESSSYDDTEFVYTPLIDENRDRELVDILPEYLTEEIAFPRNHAAKFYAKVVECMTKKVILEE